MAFFCVAVMAVGCIDEFKTEEAPIPTTVPTLVPTGTIVPTTPTIDKEEFIDKYAEASEIFWYDSYEPELKGNEYEILASSYYDNEQFNKAEERYHEAAESYSKSKEQILEAKALFEEAYEIAPTEYYKELCELYISAAQSNAKSLEYLSSAMEHMGKACDYYEKGDYIVGDEEVEEQGKDIIRYNMQIDTYNTLVEKIDEIEWR